MSTTTHRPRRAGWRFAALVAAILAGLVVAVGVALASTGASSHGHTRTLHFLLRETPQVISRGPAGPSNGDVVLLRGELLNPLDQGRCGHRGRHVRHG